MKGALHSEHRDATNIIQRIARSAVGFAKERLTDVEQIKAQVRLLLLRYQRLGKARLHLAVSRSQRHDVDAPPTFPSRNLCRRLIQGNHVAITDGVLGIVYHLAVVDRTLMIQVRIGLLDNPSRSLEP